MRLEGGEAEGRRISYGPDRDRALSLWVVFSKAYHSVAREIESDIRRRGFANPTEWAVLEYLYHKGRQPLGKIGEHILITSGSVTYVIDQLEREGYIRRARCTQDRRVIYGELTEKGRKLMEREFPEHAEAIRQVMSALAPESQESLRRLLKELGLAAARSGCLS